MTQNLRPDTRKHQQQHNADNGVQGFAFQAADVLSVRRIQQEHAHQIDGEHGVKQPGIERIPKRFLDFEK